MIIFESHNNNINYKRHGLVNNVNKCFRINETHPELDNIYNIFCMICTLILYEMSTVRFYFFFGCIQRVRKEI